MGETRFSQILVLSILWIPAIFAGFLIAVIIWEHRDSLVVIWLTKVMGLITSIAVGLTLAYVFPEYRIEMMLLCSMLWFLCRTYACKAS
jgi:hypothetical protein